MPFFLYPVFHASGDFHLVRVLAKGDPLTVSFEALEEAVDVDLCVAPVDTIDQLTLRKLRKILPLTTEEVVLALLEATAQVNHVVEVVALIVQPVREAKPVEVQRDALGAGEEHLLHE